MGQSIGRLCHVPDHVEYSDWLVGSVGDDPGSASFDLNAAPVLVESWNSTPCHGGTRRLAPVERLLVPMPMCISELLGDDEVEGASEGLLAGVPKDRSGSVIPQSDVAVQIGEENSLSSGVDNLLTEPAPIDRQIGIFGHLLEKVADVWDQAFLEQARRVFFERQGEMLLTSGDRFL